MDFANLPLMAALTRKMNWLTDRQKVISENIANVDTPRYQAQDLRPLDFKQELTGTQARLQLVSTSPAHLSGALDGVPSTGSLTKSPEDRQINGNSVSIEDELIKVSQTAADYELMTNLYKKQVGMLKEAIGHGASGG